MAIAKGVSVGPYEILSLIGEGGMGQVWRGRDRRIGRDVAVKVLSESFGAGEQAVLRFEQEARAAGALNHPGLVTIFDVGTADGSPYIVMELLEGETLRDAIGDGVPMALPLPKAIDYAIQIASALAVAHEKGIIHRDLKPENLFITTDGRVKILDFGLAKLVADAPGTDALGITRHLTTAGIAIGTPGYMSPEQVRASPLDHRTDIFSLGSVFYEMLCGRAAFECSSAIETMNAVLNIEPPPLPTVDPDIPHELDAIVRHCLEKNPRERFQSTRDLAFQLRTMTGVRNTMTLIRAHALSAPLPVPLPEEQRRRPHRAIAIAAIALLAAAGGFLLSRFGGARPQTTSRMFRQLTFGDGLELFPTLAPDGKTFAYVSSQSGNRDIYVQRVDGRTAADITSDSPEDDSEPVFSPDGDQIAFRSERDGGGIFVMGVTGESVRRLTDFGHNPSWSPDGTRIVVSTEGVELRPQVHPNRGAMWIIDSRTGAKRPLVHQTGGGAIPGGENDALQPSWSPHGNRIAFLGVSAGTAQRDLWTIDPAAPRPSQTVVHVTSDSALDWNPVWSPDGKYLYFGSNRDGTLNLWRIAMNEESGKPDGAPEPLSLPGAISGNFAFSQQGEMAFSSVTRSYRLLALPFDRKSGATGESRLLFGGSQEILSFAPSPDGQSIAFTTGGVQEDLFIANADGTRMRQLTNDAAHDRSVAWSPDGKTLYLYSNREGDSTRIWSIRADGSGLTLVTEDRDLARIGVKNAYTPSASPDGRSLLVQTNPAQALVHLDRPRGQRLEAIPGDLKLIRWSPDGKQIVGAPPGRLIVYSLETHRPETVLSHAVEWPQWLPDGRNIVFFENQRIGIFNLDGRGETTAPFAPPPGARFDFTSVLSRDGSTLYVRQTLEQGDIWLTRFEKN